MRSLSFTKKLIFCTQSSLQLLLGSYCAACQCRSPQPLCSSCISSITRPEFVCHNCGWRLPAQTSHNYCKQCIETAPAFEAFHCIGVYNDVLSRLIIAVKIDKSVAAIAALRYLYRYYVQHDRETGHFFETHRDYFILPVPSPKSRMMSRGFNLPRLLATDIGKIYTMRLMSSRSVILPFVTHKQSVLSKQKRQQNNRFYQINHKVPAKIMIVDDVFTTGETARGLSKKLRARGAQSVVVYSLARGQAKVAEKT